MIIIINIGKKMEFEKISIKLQEYIKSENLKSSNQRNEILSIFFESNKHLTVEELYDICKVKISNIGIATIYRAMKLFCKIGICSEIKIENGITRYEIISSSFHHDHLICSKCGMFIEIMSDEIEEIQKRIAEKHGFVLTSHRLNLYGTCSECRRN
jgi:Fur family transcriptional regulator, ferric uptake regulator